jgi:hypothetical protein
MRCADCHPRGRGAADFSCTGCHDHGRREMDHEHRRVRGYGYDSPACLRCHPNGEGD